MILINDNLKPYLEDKLEHIPDDSVFIGHIDDEDGSILAVAGFGHHSKYDCEGFGAGEKDRKWWTPEFMTAVYRMAFEALKKERITVRIQADRENVIKLVERNGFVREGTIRNGLGDKDVALLGLIKSECRYL